MDSLLQDLRYGLRSLAKRPGFTAVVVPLSGSAATLGVTAEGHPLLAGRGFTAADTVLRSVVGRAIP